MEIVVPELGESIVEATVAQWLKKEGDPVSVGEPVVSLETDKVDLEVGAKEDGVLTSILRKEGEDVKVGEVLGAIEPSLQGAPAKVEHPAERAEQEKTAPEKPATEPKGEKVQAQPVKSQKQVKEEESESTRHDGASERATPVARRMAEEQGIDISQVRTTHERVTKEDVERYLEEKKTAVQAPERPPVPQPKPTIQPPTPETVQEARLSNEQVYGRREERVRMSRRRRTIAMRLVEAQQTAAMLTTFNDVDMSAVMDVRNRRKESFQQRYGIKLGFMSFFVKASIGALKEFPAVNAEIQGDDIVYKYYYDIGMAIGAEEGLVVPVLRDADRMTFAQIEQTIGNYVERSREGTLSLEDLRGGTFTITNGGVFGSLLSTPILNPPQVAILGLHRIEDRPVAQNRQVVIKPMMYLALSYDHRIVDGREAVQFLGRIKELIEDPETLLLEG